MKFHCDRCKTRYSIADERVRGKILKIRCKNCQAVITVKEGGQVSGPRAARLATSDGARVAAATSSRTAPRRRAASSSGSALQGAFEEALRRPPTSAGADPVDAPAVLEAEWYVSQDGEQFGPFALAKAQAWVALRTLDDDLYCWSEGFDDWLPIEKVSHFRGLRGPGQESGLPGTLLPPSVDNERTLLSPPSQLMQQEPEDTPVPLFAATLAQVVADAGDNGNGRRNGSSVSALGLPTSRPPVPAQQQPGGLFGPAMSGPPGMTGGPAGANPTPGETNDASLDLEIGEASRVVKLPMLARRGPSGAPMGAPSLPGMSGPAVGPGTGPGVSPLGRGTGSYDHNGPGSNALAGLPVIQGGNTADVPRLDLLQPRRRAGLLLPVAIGSAVVVGVVSVLLYVALVGEDDDALVRRGEVGGKGSLAYQLDREAAKKGGKPVADDSATRTTSRKVRRPPRPSAGGGTATTQLPVGPSSDEVDLSESGGPSGELDPDDLFDVYNANKIGVTMCYNSALKRDPLLNVRRADVVITVSPSGVVSNVSIPALSGTPLGECLEKRIRSWKFRRATQVFSSRFPIIFQT